MSYFYFQDALIKFLFEKEALETKHERLRNFGVTAYTIVLTKRLALCMKRNLMAKVLSFQKVTLNLMNPSG